MATAARMPMIATHDHQFDQRESFLDLFHEYPNVG
jgi:hypothetical protein